MSLSVILSSLFSGLMGAMGFGSGTILIIYLTMAEGIAQLKAQGINLFFFVFTSCFALINYGKNKLIEKKQVLSFLPLSLSGLLLSYVLLSKIPTELLSKLFGGMLIILGIKELFIKKKE